MRYTTLYSDVQKMHRTSIRDVARKMALDGLGLKTRWFPNKALWNTPRVQFVYFHHVFEDEKKGFEQMIQMFSEDFDFISYSEAVNRIASGNIDRPYMAFSSDDGFKNNLVAADVLERFGATACFFLNPGTIGLNDLNQIRSHCAERLHFPPVEFLNWSEVDQLQTRGHEIGSHTMWHSKLSECTPEEVVEDLQSSKSALEANCGPIQHFAYPYGRWFHFNQLALEATWAAGYQSCASAERGCHIPTAYFDASRLVIRRDHLLAHWPLNHMRYFMENNVSQFQDNKNPWK